MDGFGKPDARSPELPKNSAGIVSKRTRRFIKSPRHSENERDHGEMGAVLPPPHELLDRTRSFVPPPRAERGWARLFADHVLPPELGGDLDFLTPG